MLTVSTSKKLVVVTLLCAIASITLTSCPSSDVPDAFGVSFLNNLGRPIDLKLCSDADCHSFSYSDHVPTTGAVTENLATDSVLTRWAIFDTEGRRVGCIPLEVGQVSYADASVELSQAVSCPGSHPLQLHRRKVTGS